MSLNDDLEKIRAQAVKEERIRVAYEAIIGRLSRSEAASRALKVGDAMPSFMLPNAEGHLVFSDELLKRGPLVVNFFRGNWCPYCRRTMEALETALPRIVAAGGQLVALTPDTGGHLAATKRGQGLSYDVLSDVDGAVGLQFGVLFRTPEPYRALLVGAGIDLAARHGNEGWFIPMPATYVIDQTGVVRYAFVNADFTRRAEPDEVVSVLEGLKKAGADS
ncbi:MAG TPA: peroxiredoxin-like family protein [Stellaceae bacterium]|nr:peroxiredoxin-like family protein [Stellaceae bacterium]